MGSSVDSRTWATLEECRAASDNVGIVFTPAQDLLGIDIDHCLKNNQIDHEQKENIQRLIEESDTYAEISPSGDGLHLFLALEEGGLALGANRHAPFECYTSGRYFTFTGRIFGERSDVRTVSHEEALRLLSIIGYPWKKDQDKSQSESLLEDTQVRPERRQNNPAPQEDFKLNDERVLEKMFASKNGDKIKALYDGGGPKDKSAADLSLCSHLTFWTQKDADQIERLWMASPLGGRKKTAERADYRSRTIATAIASCKEVYKPSAQRLMEKVQEASPDVEVKLDLLFTVNAKKDIVFTQNTENICRVLRKHPDFTSQFRYDSFKTVLEMKTKGKWRSIDNNEIVSVQTAISIVLPCFAKVGKDMVYDAMIKVCYENEIDSAAEFVRSITWDKKKRLDSWLSLTYGVPDDIYHRAVASNWIKGLVKRIIEPGCKFDYVLVLEGIQGSKKSTSLAILGGDWHVETTMSTDNKDFFMQFQGKAIVEFSEGETMSRTEVKKMKAIITTQIDRYRAPWGRTSQDFPRHCVFAMTTNQEQYLKDETGNRRWLPVAVQFREANVEWLAENRDQLLAEAYHRVIVAKESIHEFPHAETLAAQESRRILEPNTDLISDWYYNVLTQEKRKEGVTIHMVYQDVLNRGFVTRTLSRFEEMSIADVLKSSIGLLKKRTKIGGSQQWRWFNEQDGEASESEIAARPKTSLEQIEDDVRGW